MLAKVTSMFSEEEYDVDCYGGGGDEDDDDNCGGMCIRAW